MQTKHAVFYKASGHFTPSRLLALTLLTTFSSSLLAFPYTYLSWFMPIVQFNILLPFIWGMLNATICGLAIHKFKIRSVWLVGILVFIFSLAGLYSAWIFHADLYLFLIEAQGKGYVANINSLSTFVYVMDNFDISRFFSLAAQPERMWELMEKCYHNGALWILKESTKPLSGIPLALLWLFEGLIFLTMSVYFALKRSKKPFSEKSNDWLAEKVLTQAALPPENVNGFINNLRTQGEIAWLREAPILSDLKTVKAPIKYLILTIYRNSEQNEHYLSVTLVTKIKHRTKKKLLVEYLKIDSLSAGKIFARYS